MPAESFAIKLREASEDKDIFVVLGCLNVSGISALGVATIFVPEWPQLIADGAAVLGTFVTVGAFPDVEQHTISGMECTDVVSSVSCSKGLR